MDLDTVLFVHSLSSECLLNKQFIRTFDQWWPCDQEFSYGWVEGVSLTGLGEEYAWTPSSLNWFLIAVIHIFISFFCSFNHGQQMLQYRNNSFTVTHSIRPKFGNIVLPIWTDRHQWSSFRNPFNQKPHHVPNVQLLWVSIKTLPLLLWTPPKRHARQGTSSLLLLSCIPGDVSQIDRKTNGSPFNNNFHSSTQ